MGLELEKRSDLDLDWLCDVLDLDLKNAWTTLLDLDWFYMFGLGLEKYSDYLTGFGLILWYIGLGLEKH